MRRRLATAAAAALAMPALAGCDLDARVIVHADDTVTVDATYWLDAASTGDQGRPDGVDPIACDRYRWAGLEVERLEEATGRVGCRVTGTTTLARLNQRDHQVIHATGRYLLSVPLGEAGSQRSGARYRVAVTFPGLVVGSDNTAAVTGDTVTWTGQGDWTGGSLRAAALEAGVLPPALTVPLAAAGGLVVGVGAAGVAIGLRRRPSGDASGRPSEPGP